MLQQLDPNKTSLDQLTEALDTDGAIILSNALSTTATANAIAFGTEVTDQALQNPRKAVFDDYGKNPHLIRPTGLHLKLETPDLLLPPSALPLVEHLFRRTGSGGMTALGQQGGLFQTAGMAAHILLPGAEQRPLHRDADQIFPQSKTILPVFCLAMHIPISTFNAQNGSTRIAKGTHKLTAPKNSPLRNYHQDHASSVEAEPGDIVLFDSRVWHASGCNQSSQPRTMLSILFVAEWFGHYKTHVKKSLHEKLPHSLQACTEPTM